MSGKKITKTIVVCAVLGLLASFITIFIIKARKPNAGLTIETNVPATVFIDGTEAGSTPFDKLYWPGEKTVKIVPKLTDSSLLSNYQTKIRLTANIYSVIRREFESKDSSMFGETITFQKTPGKAPSIGIFTTTPEVASVTLDGVPQGFTPISLDKVTVGNHVLVVTSPGYLSRTINLKAVAGYKTSINVLLGLNPDLPVLVPTPTTAPSATPSGTLISPTLKTTPKPTTTPSPVTLEKPYVTILDTPVGFLRVRSGPGTGFSEVGQVTPGKSYSLLDSQSDWVLIQADLTATSSGWVSSQYVKKFE